MLKTRKATKNKSVKKNDSKYLVLSNVKLKLWHIVLEENKTYFMSLKTVELLKTTRTYKKWNIKISKS